MVKFTAGCKALLTVSWILYIISFSDVRERVEKLYHQLKWPSFPGVHSLLLKGCTNANTYEATIQVRNLSQIKG